MARTSNPHSATAQFFINAVDNAFLDHRSKDPQGWGYAVFGEVVDGMEVVDAISKVKTGQQGPMSDVPSEPVIIQKAYVEGAASSLLGVPAHGPSTKPSPHPPRVRRPDRPRMRSGPLGP